MSDQIQDLQLEHYKYVTELGDWKRTHSCSELTLADNGRPIPVKTKDPVPKDKIFEVVEAIKSLTVTLPVKMGDTLLENAAGTGVSVIACRSL